MLLEILAKGSESGEMSERRKPGKIDYNLPIVRRYATLELRVSSCEGRDSRYKLLITKQKYSFANGGLPLRGEASRGFTS